MKKEKYIKANSIIEFINKVKFEAVKKWDIDAIIACDKILKEIEDTIGILIDSL